METLNNLMLTGNSGNSAALTIREGRKARQLVDVALPDAHQQLLARYCQLITGKGYSPQTLKNYRRVFQLFLVYHLPRLPLELSKQDVLDYLAGRATDGLSETAQNLIINAIKFYYEQVETESKQFYIVPRPKRPLKYPKVLTQAEVQALLTNTANLKHRCMLMLAYGLGLRLKEVLALTSQDIHAVQLMLHVRGKGEKDRNLPLPERLLHLLREQCRQYRPITFLFEGAQPGEPYSARSLQQVVKQAAERANIRRPISLHMLRHSYATHLLEGGTDIHMIQALLGHASVKTTEIYTRVAQRAWVASPLDDLSL